MIEYKGYIATVRYQPASGTFVGVLEDVPDRVTFSGDSVEDLETEMTKAVDEYIDFCIEWGRPTDPRHAGDLTVRVSPELRAMIP